MVKINLKILEIEDVELKQNSIEPYLFTRIYITLCYKTKEDLFVYEQGLVDTGAIVSLLPKRVWGRLPIEIIGDHYIKGIVKKKECTLPVKIAKVKNKLIDEFGNETSEFITTVYCVDSDDVPLILGLKEVMDKLDLHILFSKEKAYFEEK